MTFDPQQFKSQFPLFSQPENKDLIYFDNAATTQKPQCVIDAYADFYLHANGNAQRASHRLARNATAIIENVRENSRQFIGASSKGELVFTGGATEGLNMIAYGLRHRLTANDTIVVSYGEHHANLLPWQETAAHSACQLTLVAPNLEDLPVLVLDSVTVIAVTLVSNVSGVITNLELLKKIKNSYPHIIIVIDATQWLAHRPLRVKDLPCDFLVCSAHKFFGPTGVGLLYGRQGTFDLLQPLNVGGEMVKTVGSKKSTYLKGFSALEAGTSSMANIASLGACLSFWEQQDRQAMIEHEEMLTNFLHKKLEVLCQKNNNLCLLTQADNNIGIATIAVVTPYSTADMGFWLDENNIAVRVGDHCAQLLWRSHPDQRWFAQGALRISLAAYNTIDDVEKLIHTVKKYLTMVDEQQSNGIVHPIKNNELEFLDWSELLRKKNWQQRYKQLIQWGKKIQGKPDIRIERYRIEGCESAVWCQHQLISDKHYFDVESDSSIVKGLAALLLCRMQGQSTEDISAIDFDQYFDSLGLEKHLSESRNNGFNALYRSMLSSVEH